ncbi:MAG: pyridoxamine 5'-phosphate oxidase [Neptuniibacter sp.]
MKKPGDLTATRREYIANGLEQSDLQANPIAQFASWMDETLKEMPDDATSMTLATANAQGMPSARIVLLKHFDEQGFAWYTDFRSQKGDDLAENPQAEIMFYWYPFERQVRIQGKVVKLSSEQGKKYFNQRPVGSRISAAVSHQSHPVASRNVLESAVEQMEQKYPEGDIPHPDYWGGYLLIPSRFEFWQGRENRLHDRFQYNLQDGEWSVQRLQP